MHWLSRSNASNWLESFGSARIKCLALEHNSLTLVHLTFDLAFNSSTISQPRLPPLLQELLPVSVTWNDDLTILLLPLDGMLLHSSDNHPHPPLPKHFVTFPCFLYSLLAAIYIREGGGGGGGGKGEGGRSNARVKSLAQEHNSRTPMGGRPQTSWSGVRLSNHYTSMSLNTYTCTVKKYVDENSLIVIELCEIQT